MQDKQRDKMKHKCNCRMSISTLKGQTANYLAVVPTYSKTASREVMPMHQFNSWHELSNSNIEGIMLGMKTYEVYKKA